VCPEQVDRQVFARLDERIGDSRLRGEVINDVHVWIGDDRSHGVRVPNVAADEAQATWRRQRLQPVQVPPAAGSRQAVEHGDALPVAQERG
jgi:hypothetical protein